MSLNCDNQHVGSLNGLHDGIGTKKWIDGVSYIGRWNEGKKEGKGVFTNADSSTSTGTFINNAKEGSFVIKYPNGDYKSGIFKTIKEKGYGCIPLLIKIAPLPIN